MVRRGFGLALILLGACALAVSAGAQAGELPLKIVTVAGRNEVSRAGASTWSAASLRGELGAGDGARTLAGGRLTLATPSGQALRLGALSRISVLPVGPDAGRPTTVWMDGGAVWVSVKPGSPPAESIEVQTSAVTVTVRGSGVGITLRDGSVRVRVYHGSAECSGPGAAREWTRSLSAGQETLVAPAGSPPAEVRKLTRDSVEAEWVKWNEDQDVAGGFGTKPVEH